MNKNKITVENEYFKNELCLLKPHKPLVLRYVGSLHKKIISHYSKIDYLADTSSTSLVSIQTSSMNIC